MNVHSFILTHLAFIIHVTAAIGPQPHFPSNYNNDQQGQVARRNKVTLLEERECSHELKRLCPSEDYDPDDLSILTCIQNQKAFEISQSCQDVIWQHTKDVVSDASLSQIVQPYCSDEVFCPQDVFKCVLDRLPDIKSKKCLKIIRRIEFIAFSDIKLMSGFMQDCRNDIVKQRCGSFKGDKMIPFSQGETLACLQEHLNQLEDKCHKQVVHLSELQSDDVSFDRVLDKACADVKARFCKNVQSPEEVYSCLMQHRDDDYTRKECRNQLNRREKLISQDFQVSKGLSRACKEYIKTYRCRRWLSDDKEVRLAQILVCLENAIHNETSSISTECIREMKEHRQILLEDYKLTPEIVSQCSTDITTFCKGLQAGGKTIHCLMEHSRPNRNTGRVSFPCQIQLEKLVKTADMGEDWRVDPVLREACQSVVSSHCPEIRGGNARVMSCLMDKLGTYKMTEKCESALLQIQYFVARNFRLDPALYRACRADAHKLCHAKMEWATPNEAYSPKGVYVLPCLYRYLRNDEVRNLKPVCKEEVQRVMRQRALHVELNPEIEQVCLDDLAAKCKKSGKGEEIDCLQGNLDRLQDKCRDVIRNYTEVQMEDVQVNPIIMKNCAGFIDKYCQNEENKDVMDCLIRVKNEQSLREQVKCRATIEHYQLTTLQDFRFTVAFKNACQSYVSRYCVIAKTKSQIIECLSEIVRNDTLLEVRNKISKNCRQQLRSQLLSQRENIELNPKLKTACEMDVKKFCKGVTPGSARVLECLKEHKKKLSEKCHHIMFKIEEQDLTDSSTDYTLLATCKTMIASHCPDTSQALTCLKEVKDQPGFDLNCKMIVVKRIIEQNQDYRFNPVLTKACKLDMVKFCSDLIKSPPADTEMEGKVVKCLKIKFRQRKLRSECEQQLVAILKEAALNYKLNPLLQNLCTEEIDTLCKGKDDDQEGGSVEECLKAALQNGQIVNRACRLEVVGLIEETRVDIHVDPLLHRACASDLNVHCADTPPGGGRHIQCLLNIISDPVKAEGLNHNCHVMLSQRLELFREASHNFVALPQSMGDLYGQVSHSPQKKYLFLVLFSCIGMVFLSGLFFGRASRRTMYSLLATNSKSKL